VLVGEEGEADVDVTNSGSASGLFVESVVPWTAAGSWVVEAAGKLRGDPAMVRALAEEIQNNGNPASCKYEMLALGLARTEASRSALLDILVSDAHPQLKMLAAAGAGMTFPPGDGSIKYRLDGITFQVNVEAIRDEALLRAVCMELRLTEDELAEDVLVQVLQYSAQKEFVAEQLWRWAISAEDGAQVPERADKIVVALQKNPALYGRSRKLLEDVACLRANASPRESWCLGGLRDLPLMRTIRWCRWRNG
jgi:hypothetical protein